MRLIPLFLALLSCAKAPPVADPALAASARLRDPIPPDPSVRTGTFENGMRWFVQHNEEPDDRLVLRLVVKVGSIVEDEDQRGLAHLVEHMAFNGTTHFPGNDVIHVLEGFGAQFGPDINAHTSFDETVYKLTVPTDDPKALDQAFLVFEDWAHGLTLDPAEVQAERGVVLEEWRRAQGAGFRVREKIMPFEYGEQYASRMPIGTRESLEGFQQGAVERFVADWYRPDLMAIIVVGDVEPDWAEAKIRQHFEGIPPAKSARERPRGDVPSIPERRAKVVTDPELTYTSVSYAVMRDDVERTDHGGARENAVENLMQSIVSERLQARSRQPDRPFQRAWASTDRLSPDEGSRELAAVTREGGAMAGLEALLTEWARIGAHGFNPSELERARTRELAGLEEMIEQRDDRDSAGEANELVRVFMNGEYYTDIGYEYEMMKRFYADVTLADVNDYARTWLEGEGQIVEVILPAKEGAAVPTKDDVAALADRVLATTPEALTEQLDEGPLVADPPTGGQVTAEERLDPGLGFVRWTLSNGVVVWFKQTDFTPDQVQLRSISPGGAFLASDADWHAATTAVAIAQESGFGPYDAEGLERRLAGRQVQIGPYVGNQAEGFYGSARTADLPVAFELLWLEATAPRFDDAAFERLKGDYANSLSQRDAEPETAFRDALTAAVWGDALRYRPWKLPDLENLDLGRSRAFYADRFADLSDSTFVIVGDAEEADVKALAAKWLGSLPAGGRVETAPDPGARRIPGQATVAVTSGTEPKAHVRVTYFGSFESDYLSRNRLVATADILSVLLREELREKRSGVYGVSASTSTEEFPTETYELAIDFVCDPERVTELQEAALAIADRMRTTPVEAHYVADEQAKQRRERQIKLKDDGFWVSAITTALQNGEDPLGILDWDARNDSLAPAVIQEAAARYLDPANRKIVVRNPTPAK